MSPGARPPEVNGLAHAAYAKAHFLSGRPGAGLEILRRMVASGAGEDGRRGGGCLQ